MKVQRVVVSSTSAVFELDSVPNLLVDPSGEEEGRSDSCFTLVTAQRSAHVKVLAFAPAAGYPVSCAK